MKKNITILIGLFVSINIVLFAWWINSEPNSLLARLKNQAQKDTVDFDLSMQRKNYLKIADGQKNDQFLYNFFKNLYQQHNLTKLAVYEKHKIPKIIHHIWMGSKMRQEDEPLYASWHKYHPDWTFIFWTDNPLNYDKGNIIVSSFDALEKILKENHNSPQCIVIDVNNLKFENRKYFDQATNYGERGDILDYEIVYRFGGMYVDCDFECYKPFDIFHHVYDFYTGIQPLDTNCVQLGAALFAAIPKHPILENCVVNIKNNRHIPQIIVKTGPIYFTRIFYQTVKKTGLKDVALPSSYFYPCGYEQRHEPSIVWRRPVSFGTHHWAGSWLEKEAFVQNELS